jgi:hypothetical protein
MLLLLPLQSIALLLSQFVIINVNKLSYKTLQIGSHKHIYIIIKLLG